MIHGVLPVLKPKGYTSFDVVSKLRRLLKQKRIGHTGTLDPEVEGVLPICIGQATRIVEYLQEMEKCYRGALQLGIATDTEDQTGKVLEETKVDKHFQEEEIQQAMHEMVGEIEQIPPMYSAVKVKGQRLYELARKGEVVERKARKVRIYDFRFLSLKHDPFPVIHFEVTCSKGTYVRTLCVDLGKKLGYPAHMVELLRTKSGPFSLADCVTLEELEQLETQEQWQKILVPIGDALSHFPSVIVSEEEAAQVLNGISLQVEIPMPANNLVRVYSSSGRFLALYKGKKDGILAPEKVFRDVE